MTQQNRPPEPRDKDWQTWGRRMMSYLSQTRSALVQQTGDESAADDGTLMWDRENLYPVVSKNGAWVQVVLEDGKYAGAVSTDQTAASTNTAYALTYTSSAADGITNGTPASRLVFAEAGQYMVSFSAQIASTSSSTVNFWFWPRVNGADVTGSTMKNALHQNGSVLVVSRSAILDLSAGDYLEAMWAVDSTSGFLDATAATAFAPAAPASTIAITRLHG
tara:strand:- start:305 stop:964 length:660 start_codon:yes stop_codon:yes gene_type:complete